MSTLHEMAAAFHQARTAPDVTDRATGLEEADRIGGVALVQARLQGQGAEVVPGARFGWLTVIEPAVPHLRSHWICECACGTRKSFPKSDLLRAKHATKSCGCMRGKSHGMYKTATYRTWGSMLQRATNHSNDRAADYVDRGITVCEEWKVFENFLRDMGERPAGKTLDRIDNSKGYSPENCRWATAREQQNNTRRNRFLTINGETKTVAAWADECGIKPGTIYSRIARGWTGQDLLLAGTRAGFRRVKSSHPAARRKAYPSAVCCIDCQSLRERRHG